MISGYWCKLRQVPLKVLPFCRVPVKFIEYLTRPLGFFFVSVDTDKSSRAQSSAMPRPAERIWGLTFANLRHSEIDRNFGVLRIYCRVPCSADAMTFCGFFYIFLSGLMRQPNILVLLYCRVHHRCSCSEQYDESMNPKICLSSSLFFLVPP
jgi:hypothetical protein